MPKYEMVIHVESADDMATIVQACKGSAELISSNQVKEAPRAKKRKKSLPRPPVVEPGSLKGIDLARKMFSDGKPHTTSELTSVFVASGFNEKSASPALSNLHTKFHEVKLISPGTYIATQKLRPISNSAGH